MGFLPHNFYLVLFLFLQHKTMQMMYEMIYNALKEVGLENKYEPQDYLNFFCLGNREAPDTEDSSGVRNSTAVKTPQVFPFICLSTVFSFLFPKC